MVQPNCSIDNFCLPDNFYEEYISLVEHRLSYEAIMNNRSVDVTIDIHDARRIIDVLDENRFRAINNLRKALPYARFHIEGEQSEALWFARDFARKGMYYRRSGDHTILNIDNRDKLSVINCPDHTEILLSSVIAPEIRECAQYARDYMTILYQNKKELIKVIS